MANRADMLEALAERVEKASGPDRVIDVLIGCAIGYVPDKPGCEWAKEPHWQYVPMPRISGSMGCADKSGNVAAHWEAPAYTASLDQAMTLVPEGFGWRLWMPNSSADLIPSVTLWGNGRTYAPRETSAATPAAALTAACLRAHASILREKGNG